MPPMKPSKIVALVQENKELRKLAADRDKLISQQSDKINELTQENRVAESLRRTDYKLAVGKQEEIDQNKLEISRLNERLVINNAVLAARRFDILNLEKLVMDKREVIDAKNTNIAELAEKLKSQDSKIKELETAAQCAAGPPVEEVAELREQIKASNEFMRSQAETIKELRRDVEDRQSVIGQLGESLAQQRGASIENLSNELKEKVDVIQGLQQEVEKLSADLKLLRDVDRHRYQTICDQKEEIAAKNQRIAELTATLSTRAEALIRKNDRLLECERDIARLLSNNWLYAKELKTIKEAIHKVVTCQGDDVCWADVWLELGKFVDVEVTQETLKLLPKEKFLSNCSKFIDSLHSGCPYTTPPAQAEMLHDPNLSAIVEHLLQRLEILCTRD